MTEFTGERVIPGEVEQELWNEHMARYVFAAQYAAGRCVLDIGCGAGYGAAHLAQTAHFVAAVDIAEDAISYARAHYPIANLSFEAAPAQELPFDGGKFGLITAFEVIEHVEDWPGLLRECARVLAPDGIALISTPNRLYYTASRGPRGANPFHAHEFEFAEFEHALRDRFAGVSVLVQNRTECMTFYPHRAFPPAAASLDSASGSPESAHFFVGICAHRPDLARPVSFIYVPRASNLLREREQHIEALTRELSEAREAHERLLEAHRAQTVHLEEQNRWALDTAAELSRALARVAEVQEELKAVAAGYEQKVKELEADANAKAAWALDYERRLHETEAELERVRSRLEETEGRVAMIRDSRWVRIGRSIGVGPDLQQ